MPNNIDKLPSYDEIMKSRENNTLPSYDDIMKNNNLVRVTKDGQNVMTVPVDEAVRLTRDEGYLLEDNYQDQQKLKDELASKYNNAEVVAGGGVKGFSFGLNDELTAAADTLIDGGSYSKNLEARRLSDELKQRKSPGLYTAGEVGGAILNPINYVPGALPTRMAVQAGGGAVSNLGNLDGKDFNATNFAVDTAIGAGGELVSDFVAPALRAGGSKLSSGAKNTVRWIGKKLGVADDEAVDTFLKNPKAIRDMIKDEDAFQKTYQELTDAYDTKITNPINEQTERVNQGTQRFLDTEKQVNQNINDIKLQESNDINNLRMDTQDKLFNERELYNDYKYNLNDAKNQKIAQEQLDFNVKKDLSQDELLNERALLERTTQDKARTAQQLLEESKLKTKEEINTLKADKKFGLDEVDKITELTELAKKEAGNLSKQSIAEAAKGESTSKTVIKFKIDNIVDNLMRTKKIDANDATIRYLDSLKQRLDNPKLFPDEEAVSGDDLARFIKTIQSEASQKGAYTGGTEFVGMSGKTIKDVAQELQELLIKKLPDKGYQESNKEASNILKMLNLIPSEAKNKVKVANEAIFSGNPVKKAEAEKVLAFLDKKYETNFLAEAKRKSNIPNIIEETKQGLSKDIKSINEQLKTDIDLARNTTDNKILEIKDKIKVLQNELNNKVNTINKETRGELYKKATDYRKTTKDIKDTLKTNVSNVQKEAEGKILQNKATLEEVENTLKLLKDDLKVLQDYKTQFNKFNEGNRQNTLRNLATTPSKKDTFSIEGNKQLSKLAKETGTNIDEQVKNLRAANQLSFKGYEYANTSDITSQLVALSKHSLGVGERATLSTILGTEKLLNKLTNKIEQSKIRKLSPQAAIILHNRLMREDEEYKNEYKKQKGSN